MKHVLPLKEKEIEQRRLEAEARKVQKMKDAEGDAEARKSSRPPRRTRGGSCPTRTRTASRSRARRRARRWPGTRR